MLCKPKIVIILFCALAALAAAIFAVRHFTAPKTDFGEYEISGWLNPGAPREVGLLQAGISAAFRTYTHSVHGFSFDYPADWVIDDSFKEEGEEAVLIQNEETGIAVFIYPFDEPGPITKKRVLKDVPDMKIENEIALKIANGSIDALGFDSNERELGPTKEVWFVYGGYLYQISGAEGSGETLYKVVSSWKFQQ